MKNQERSLQTKKALAASLKKFMVKKELKKITVADIINDCNVNRKTFYYHFRDIYDLLTWILEQEAFEVAKKLDMANGYKEPILFAVDYVESNAHILACAYDSIGREEMKPFLYNDFLSITKNIVDETEAELGLSVNETFKAFLYNYCADSIASMLICWFKEPHSYSKEQFADFLSIVLTSSLREALKNADKWPH